MNCIKHVSDELIFSICLYLLIFLENEKKVIPITNGFSSFHEVTVNRSWFVGIFRCCYNKDQIRLSLSKRKLWTSELSSCFLLCIMYPNVVRKFFGNQFLREKNTFDELLLWFWPSWAEADLQFELLARYTQVLYHLQPKQQPVFVKIVIDKFNKEIELLKKGLKRNEKIKWTCGFARDFTRCGFRPIILVVGWTLGS
jgi:hypothetical protein